MGYAHGTLLKVCIYNPLFTAVILRFQSFIDLLQDQLHTFLNDLWVYLDDQVVPKILPYLPPWLAYIVADLGLQAALEAYYYITKPYTGDYFYQELQGIADGAYLSHY